MTTWSSLLRVKIQWISTNPQPNVFIWLTSQKRNGYIINGAFQDDIITHQAVRCWRPFLQQVWVPDQAYRDPKHRFPHTTITHLERYGYCSKTSRYVFIFCKWPSDIWSGNLASMTWKNVQVLPTTKLHIMKFCIGEVRMVNVHKPPRIERLCPVLLTSNKPSDLMDEINRTLSEVC